MTPAALSPPYWVLMGATGIIVLAGSDILTLPATLPAVSAITGFVEGICLVFWSFGTWWIPLLIVLGFWRHVLRQWPLPDQDLASRLDVRDLARLAAAGARPAGPPPLPPASGDVIEVERTVNASGSVSLGNHIISAGLPLAGQRITLRLDGPVAHIMSGGILVRTVACPVPPEARSRLRGARSAAALPPRLPEAPTVTRRVSVRGAIMIGGQRIQVGLAHARKTAEVTVEADTYQITVDPGITITAARITSREIRRHKASNYPPSLP